MTGGQLSRDGTHKGENLGNLNGVEFSSRETTNATSGNGIAL